jgi:hypothetical protein
MRSPDWVATLTWSPETAMSEYTPRSAWVKNGKPLIVTLGAVVNG